MKKFVMLMLMFAFSISHAVGQSKADIKFDELSHNFGDFSESNPVVSHVFTFTNVGDGPLVIHQAYASCGCTVPEYTQEPILPGKQGTVKVTYNGTGRRPGYFKKSVTLRTNAKADRVMLYIEGDMKEKGNEKDNTESK